MRFPVLVFALVVLSSSLALSNERVRIPQTVVPTAHNVETGGYYIGADFDTLYAHAEKELEGIRIFTSTHELKASHRGAEVVSEDYPRSISADGLYIGLSGPSSGNAAYIVSRDLAYRDILASPTLDTLRHALTEKYGPISGEQAHEGRVRFAWAYREGEQISCAIDRFAFHGDICAQADPRQAVIQAPIKLEHIDFLISAEIRLFSEDRSKVGLLRVNLIDYGLIRDGWAANAAAMEAAAIERFERLNDAEVIPSL